MKLLYLIRDELVRLPVKTLRVSPSILPRCKMVHLHQDGFFDIQPFPRFTKQPLKNYKGNSK